MTAAAAKRGMKLTSLSRPLRPDDLVRFDYILAMDFENKAAVELATDHWAGEGYPIPPKYRDKVSYTDDPYPSWPFMFSDLLKAVQNKCGRGVCIPRPILLVDCACLMNISDHTAALVSHTLNDTSFCPVPANPGLED